MNKVFAREKYKSCPPEKTCNDILKILSHIGIKTNLFETNNQKYGTFSTRLNIANKELISFNIGTNGKGTNLLYANASAFGEFMERLQNGLLLKRKSILLPRNIKKIEHLYPKFIKLLHNKDLLPKYTYAPDEIEISSQEEISSLHLRYFQPTSTINVNPLKIDSCILLPFWSVSKKRTELLPYDSIRLLCGSNGMCAGNTPQEAIVQGIYEIIERYIIKRIISDNITPPNIPLDLFIGTKIYNLISNLKKKLNCELIIKDCSLNEKWPAIGILLIDYPNRKYYFHLGVDSSPITALERCLSEMLQGSNEINFKKIDIKSQDKFRTNSSFRNKNIASIFINNTGIMPYSIFSTSFSYIFKDFNYGLTMDDEIDIHLICSHIQSKGFNIFIRDVSYLGFPSFHIFISGMSEVYDDPLIISQKNRDLTTSFLRCHHKTNNINEIKELLLDIEALEFSPNLYSLFQKNDLWESGNISLLKGILYLRSDNFEKAYHQFTNLKLEEPNSKKSIFYQFGADYSYIQKHSKTELDSYLNDTYSDKFAAIAKEYLLNTPINKLFTIPPCFDCDSCKSLTQCQLFPFLLLCKKLESEYKKNLPDQEQLKHILS